jgi:hypothetical protein
MFIKDVDDALERLLRARLPLPREVGDVGFDAPNDTWSAQLSRLTVNLFLYSIERSTHPNRTAHARVDEGTGRGQRRAPQPMIELSYLVSAWAGSPADEHQLLGDVVSILAGTSVLPAEHVSDRVTSSVTLTMGTEDGTRPRDVWQGLGGKLKACLLLRATVAADTFDWEDQAPAVARISVLSSPEPMPRAALLP